MAYQAISNGNGDDRKKSTEMEIGESIEGYVVDLPETNGDFGEQTNLLIQNDDSTVLLYTAGTLKYDARDGRIKVGLKTKITRLEDEKRKSKAGKAYTTSVFEVLQDPEDSIQVGAPVSAVSSNIKERAEALKQKQAK